MERTDIEKLSKLSRLDVSPDEMDSLLGDLRSILTYVEEIKKVSTSTSPDTVESHTLVNIMRADGVEHSSGVTTKELLKNAPRSSNGFIEVSQVFE